MQVRKNLPIGIENFEKLIQLGYRYVDKTAYIHRLCTQGEYYFLARPRRFGKSLLLSTIECLYQGKKELFKGLWIEEQWDWSQTNPVLRFSMKDIGLQTLPLQEAIIQLIDKHALRAGISLRFKGIAPRFAELLEQLCERHGPVVVLIDEYDAPILDFLGVDEDRAKENRDLLREFYTVLKGSDSFIRKAILTGVSKFSRVGVFSGLNNLDDITRDAAYASMLGYTQEELEADFALELQEVAEAYGMEITELLGKTKAWYNGFRFEEYAPSVYNPFSTHQFLSKKKFDNYWFTSGTPNFLINLLRQRNLYEISEVYVGSEVFGGFEVEDMDEIPLLLQTGYLTLQGVDKYSMFALDFPNQEVRESFNKHLLMAFSGMKIKLTNTSIMQLRIALMEHKLDAIGPLLSAVFASVPYDLTKNSKEAFYHATLHLLFTCLGLSAQSEVHVSTGRIDTVIETATHIYILEYKLDHPLQAALSQIREKQYPEKYRAAGKPLIGIGLCFSSQTRNLESFGWEEL